MLTLRQLRAFSVCAQTLSFTIAAQRLHLSQSAVSLLIRELETSLGLPLFERGRRLSLTESGQRFAAQTARLLTDLDVAVANVRGAHEAQLGVLRVGVGHLLAGTCFVEAAAAFRQRHPGIQVQVVDCLVEQLSQKVLDGEVDFGIGSIRPPDRHSELRIDALFRDTIHVTSARPARPASTVAGQPPSPPAPARARLRRAAVTWQSLEAEPLIVVNAGNSVWATVSPTLARAGIRFNPAHQVTLYSTGVGLARHGFGRLLLPGFCARMPEFADLNIRPVSEPVFAWDVSVLYRRSAPPGALATELLEALRTAATGKRSGPADLH